MTALDKAWIFHVALRGNLSREPGPGVEPSIWLGTGAIPFRGRLHLGEPRTPVRCSRDGRHKHTDRPRNPATLPGYATTLCRLRPASVSVYFNRPLSFNLVNHSGR